MVLSVGRHTMSAPTLTRRTLLAGMAAASFAATGRAQGQGAWPGRPVRVMVPYPPAGGADTTARILYAKASADLGQPFVVENRGGAGGTIGEAVVAKAAPDGYTVLHDATAFSVNGALYPNLPFDYRKDFEPVCLVSLVPNILVVTPSVPANTVEEVIALAKSRPTGSTWPRPATAPCSISRSRCSVSAPASRSTTCRIAAAGWRSPT